MWIIDLAMVKLLKQLAFLKAPIPMWVTEFGMVKLTKELQPQKAPSPMLVTDTEFGIVKFTE